MVTRISETNPVCSSLENGFSRATSTLNKSFEWLKLAKSPSFAKEMVKLQGSLLTSDFWMAAIAIFEPLGPSLSLTKQFPTTYKIFCILTHVIVKQRIWLDSYFPKDCIWNLKVVDNMNISTRIIGVALEELVCRVFIQNILMNGIARMAPEKIQPLIAHKVTRIFISSTLFALLHVHVWDTKLGPFPQFYGGLFFGHVYEKWGFTASTAFHLASLLQMDILTSLL